MNDSRCKRNEQILTGQMRWVLSVFHDSLADIITITNER